MTAMYRHNYVALRMLLNEISIYQNIIPGNLKSI